MSAQYQTIVADPPWPIHDPRSRPITGKGGRRARATTFPYEVMTMDDIRALPVADIAAENCRLFVWVAHPFDLDGGGFRWLTLGVLTQSAAQSAGASPHSAWAYSRAPATNFYSSPNVANPSGGTCPNSAAAIRCKSGRSRAAKETAGRSTAPNLTLRWI